MKKLFLLLFSIYLHSASFAQTNATDFNVADCDGNNRHLFAELYAGKVVVLCWVMPCSPCITPSLTTYNVVASYATSHPGRVIMYIIDDFANTDCSSLKSWGTSNSMPSPAAFFCDASITEDNFGGNGMPHIVVTGGNDHKIFYNAKNSVDATALQNSISSALISTDAGELTSAADAITAYPNPAEDFCVLKFSTSTRGQTNINFYNMLGEKVKTISCGIMNPGTHQQRVALDELESGMYFVQIDDGKNNSVVRITKTK